MSQQLFGGCFCGSIRYRIEGDPVLQLLCYCKDCLSTTGTSGYAGHMVKVSDFFVIEGEPKSHTRNSEADRKVIRHFCGECGTNLFGVTEFGLVSVAAGTLDDPNVFMPTKKVFVSEAPHWASIRDDLEQM